MTIEPDRKKITRLNTFRILLFIIAVAFGYFSSIWIMALLFLIPIIPSFFNQNNKDSKLNREVNPVLTLFFGILTLILAFFIIKFNSLFGVGAVPIAFFGIVLIAGSILSIIFTKKYN